MKSLMAVFAALAFLTTGVTAAPSQAQTAQELVDQSARTAERLLNAPNAEDFRALADRARAFLIVPDLVRAGFVIGGEGGNGVLVARRDDGTWSAPAFFGIGGASIGLQLGGQRSEIIFAIMTERGLNAMLERRVRLGGEAGLAVGEIGRGVRASSGLDLEADVYALSESRGLFGGATIEGSVVQPLPEWNAQYYGEGATVRGILFEGTHNREGADALRAALP